MARTCFNSSHKSWLLFTSKQVKQCARILISSADTMPLEHQNSNASFKEAGSFCRLKNGIFKAFFFWSLRNNSPFKLISQRKLHESSQKELFKSLSKSVSSRCLSAIRKGVTSLEGKIWRHKKAITEKQHLCGTMRNAL